MAIMARRLMALLHAMLGGDINMDIQDGQDEFSIQFDFTRT
jgi:hypothetical protein